MSCHLLCVEPKRVPEFWPHVSHLIKSAMQKGRLSDFASVEHDVMSGHSGTLLWLAWDGQKIKAAVVTALNEANDEKFCTIVACGGSNRSEWMHLLEGLEKYARDERCKSVRVRGRWGWKRLLTGYRIQSVTLEKRI